MTSLGLKLFYLRTRERNLSQEALAQALGIRQATLSCIEQGASQPSSPMLLELARFFDVTPTFLLDSERGVVPLPSERWSMRNALVTVGMWIEVHRQHLVDVGDGKLLCPLLPGESFYDEEARQLRQRGAADQQGAASFEVRRSAEQALVQALHEELQLHPRRRPRREPADGPRDDPGRKPP